MFSSKTVLSLIFSTLSLVGASPLSRRSGKYTLSLSRRINMDGTLNIVEKDRARVQALQQIDQFGACSDSLDIVNTGSWYTTEVGVGSPPTNYTLLVDTGSANTWVGANKPYTPTRTSNNTGHAVSVYYDSGCFSGEEWTDQVTLSPELVITRQSIGVANSSYGFAPLDGILGLGPVDLTGRTVRGPYTVPTVLDNLYSQGVISEEVFGVYFVPASESNSNGKLTFGGYDTSVIAGPVDYVPVTTTSLASLYWGIDQSIMYGGKTILSSTSGIVDTGTTVILIPTDSFRAYQSATGAVLDGKTGLLHITSEQYDKLDTLKFKIGNKSYDLTPNAQIWPRSLNAAIGGNPDSIYLIVNDMGQPRPGPLPDFRFVMGYTFLERYYGVFDFKNRQIGFAKTAYTRSRSN